MAKQMQYEDERGVQYPASYWKVGFYQMSPVDKTARVLFYGYASQETRNASPSKAPVGMKEYNVSGDRFDAFFALADIEGEGKNVVKQCYALAMATPEGFPPQPVYNSEDGTWSTPEDTRKSFFDGASDV